MPDHHDMHNGIHSPLPSLSPAGLHADDIYEDIPIILSSSPLLNLGRTPNGKP